MQQHSGSSSSSSSGGKSSSKSSSSSSRATAKCAFHARLLRSVSKESRFGLDIGGSLLKLIYLELDENKDDPVVRSLAVLDNLRSPRGSLDVAQSSSPASPPLAAVGSAPKAPGSQGGRATWLSGAWLTVNVPALGGRLHFAHFATVDVEAAVEILRRHRLCDGLESIQATGGGAHKYRELIERQLDLELHPCNGACDHASQRKRSQLRRPTRNPSPCCCARWPRSPPGPRPIPASRVDVLLLDI